MIYTGQTYLIANSLYAQLRHCDVTYGAIVRKADGSW